MYLIHPSSIGKIMTEAQSIDKSLLNDDDFERMKMLVSPDEAKVLMASKKKTDEDKSILEPLWDYSLSVGSKTYLKSIVQKILFEYEIQLDLKSFTKGLSCEQTAIELVNSVYFKNYVKHIGRIETDLMSGECDIYVPNLLVRDIKNAWSKDTFPLFIEDARDFNYEYQGRAYMHLYNVPNFYLDWCLVDTPEEIISSYEDRKLHDVSGIDRIMRVTTVHYERNFEIEKKMLLKCREAQLYIERMKKQAMSDHGYDYEEISCN